MNYSKSKCKLEIRLPSKYNLTFNIESTKLGFEIIKKSKIKKKRGESKGNYLQVLVLRKYFLYHTYYLNKFIHFIIVVSFHQITCRLLLPSCYNYHATSYQILENKFKKIKIKIN